MNVLDIPEGLDNELLPLYATVAIFRAVERASGLASRLQHATRTGFRFYRVVAP